MTDGSGLTVLHRAAECGSSWAVGQLILACPSRDTHHSLVNSRDEKGNTPLHVAVRRNGPEVVEKLLNAGADASLKNTSGFLPYDCAKDNHRLKDTDAYWRLHEARFCGA